MQALSLRARRRICLAQWLYRVGSHLVQSPALLLDSCVTLDQTPNILESVSYLEN